MSAVSELSSDVSERMSVAPEVELVFAVSMCFRMPGSGHCNEYAEDDSEWCCTSNANLSEKH